MKRFGIARPASANSEDLFPTEVERDQPSNGKEALDVFRSSKPDVTLMDLKLPDVTGIEVITAIRREFPDARMIVLTTFKRDVEIRQAWKAGAGGFLLKSMPPSQILEAIRQVHRGKKLVPPEIAAGLAEYMGDESLSEREVEVLREVAAGNRNRDIGKILLIAEETVKVHLKHIMDKLNANDRTESVTIAARRGFIQL